MTSTHRTRQRTDRTDRLRADQPYVCRACGGPCRAYAGSRHGWTCSPCLSAYVAAQLDRHDQGKDCAGGTLD